MNRKIQVGAEAFDRRQVGLLRLTNGDKVSFGEVSPLPGLSRESLADVTTLSEKFPSVEWGIRSAQKNALDRPARRVDLCALLLEDELSPTEQSLEFEKAGFTTLKIKVGSDLDADLAKLGGILQKTNKIKLRLDFNRRCSREEILRFSSELKSFTESGRIEYFEDPCLSSDRDLEMGFEAAVDEGVVSANPNDNRWFVVKPTITGSTFIESLPANKKFILSSAYESNLGIFSAGQAALDWNRGPWAHGLDTGKYFGENLFEMKIHGGQLHLPSDVWVRATLTQLTSGLKPLVEREI